MSEGGELLSPSDIEGQRSRNEAGELDINGLRREKSMQIINSILTNGLTSAKDQEKQGKAALASQDISSPTAVHGRLVIPLNKEYVQNNVDFTSPHYYDIPVGDSKWQEIIPPSQSKKVAKFLLDNALYGQGHPIFGKRADTAGRALLPVVTERDSTHAAVKSTSEYENRINQSIIIVVPVENLKDEDLVEQRTKSFDRDMQLVSPVKPEKFSEIIMPKQLAKELGPEVIDKITVPVKIVGKKFTKEKVPYGRYRVPNYEKEIKEVLEEMDGPVFIHAVRLPTNEDIIHEASQQKSESQDPSSTFPQ